MSERPGVVLGLLLAAAAVLSLMLTGALASLGGDGLIALVGAILAAFSACFFLVTELHGVPTSSLVLVAIVCVSLGAFGRLLVVSLRQQRLLRSLAPERVRDERLLRVARSAGLRELWIVSARRPGAFCFGLLRPRVVVTRGLLEQLEPDEQVAAIWHEAHHACAREPLRCLLARLAAASFFWLPVLHDLCDRYLLLKELDADRLAVSRSSRRALAGALWQVGAAPAPAGAVSLGELAEARVDRLLDPAAALPKLWRRSRLCCSAASIAALASVAAFPTRLDLSACLHLGSLLGGSSLHDLPGMAAGFTLDGFILALVVLAVRRRRLASDRGRDRRHLPVR